MVCYKAISGSHARSARSHLVAKLHRPALVGFHFCQMESDVPVEFLEELYPIADQDRENRVTNFVGQPATKAFARHHAASHKPDAPERRTQPSVHELGKIARVKFRRVAISR